MASAILHAISSRRVEMFYYHSKSREASAFVCYTHPTLTLKCQLNMSPLSNKHSSTCCAAPAPIARPHAPRMRNGGALERLATAPLLPPTKTPPSPGCPATRSPGGPLRARAAAPFGQPAVHPPQTRSAASTTATAQQGSPPRPPPLGATARGRRAAGAVF